MQATAPAPTVDSAATTEQTDNSVVAKPTQSEAATKPVQATTPVQTTQPAQQTTAPAQTTQPAQTTKPAQQTTAPTQATQPVETTTPAFDKPVMRFVVTSDVHIRTTANNYQSHDHLEELYKTAYAYADAQLDYNKLDGIFFVGDITNNGTIAEYTHFFDYVKQNTRTGTVAQAVLGNHEFYDTGNYNANSMAQSPIRFMEQSGDASVDTNQLIGGYHFITMGMDKYNKNTNTYFSSTKLAWLKTQLDAAVAEDPAKPIFLFQHEPPMNTVVGSYGTNGDKALTTLLTNYPQVIDFSGHSHRPISNIRSIWQDTFTAVNTGSLAYLSLPIPDHSSYAEGGPIAVDKEGSWNLSFTEGDRNGVLYWIVETDKNSHVRMQIYNMETQSVWGEPYIIDSLNPENFKYTDARKEVSDKPVFAANAALTLQGLTYKTAAITIPQATSKDVVQSYRIELYQGGTLKSTIYRLACTYYGDATPTTVLANIGKLEPSTTYTAKVYAVNSWAKESDPLVLNFTTKAVGDAIQADVLSVSFRQDGTAVNAITGEELKTFGAPTVAYDEKLGKYVASFDGKDDAYTYEGISSWYKPMAQGLSLETYVYLEKKPSSGFMDPAANLNSAGFGLGYKSDGKLYFYCSAGSTSYTTVGATVSTGQWVHAVGTYDGANVSLYLNGQLVAQKAASGDLTAPSLASRFFGIGADTGKNNQIVESMFKGKIADVKIYSADLNAEQIAVLYAAYAAQ